MIEVRELKDPQEFYQTINVQKSAWRTNDCCTNVTPPPNLIAAARNGGLVLGAFDNNRLIGFSYAFIGRDSQGYYLYSHQTGVIEEEKYKGVGFQLKLAQMKWAIKQGFDRIKWTFDPLQSLNSYFNISKLGVIVREYHENYYGEMNDGINRNLPTDRAVAEWYIKSRRVEMKIEGKLRIKSLSDLKTYFEAIRIDEKDKVPIDVNPSGGDFRIIAIAIPRDINKIRDQDPNLALKWRLITRKAFNLYLKGRIDVEVITEDKDFSYHILINKPLDNILNGELV
ncbi:MAG: hypothetical protein OWQ54_04070 [Sulfolobaceae archaeon]|nr:hypothetical protein [Sulfolobaceae archaeon]